MTSADPSGPDRVAVVRSLAGAPVIVVVYDTGQFSRGRAAEPHVITLPINAGTGPELTKP